MRTSSQPMKARVRSISVRKRPSISSTPASHGTCPKCECLDHILTPSQCAEQGSSGQQVVLSNDLVDAWHPVIAKAVLKNWRMSEDVCEAVGAQAEGDVVRTGTWLFTDVLVTGIRLAKRMKNHYDAPSLSAGGVLARLNLSVEECQSLVNDAAADVRALERVLRS